MANQTTTTQADSNAKPILLFVDDERRVLTSMRAMFRREYEVLLANSGQEAIEFLKNREAIHVVVSDQRMPEMTGVELLAKVKVDHPATMRILLTGYADLDAVEASINESEVFRYLMKPCPTEELKDAVRLAVQATRVSELAGVDELAALPDEDLEKIELTRVVEEPVRKKALVKKAKVKKTATRQSAGAIKPAPFTATEGSPEGLGEKAVSNLDPALKKVIADGKQTENEIVPEVLVLTQDPDLWSGVKLAVGQQYSVREADSTESALRKLSDYPIGVLITDLAVDEREIDELTRVLKREVPELVTIIASDRSDASLLIGLINHGQIFRFLLKPLQVAQTRIWLNSAMTKYTELCTDSNSVLRHQVVLDPEVDTKNAGMFASVRSRINNIRKRFSASVKTGLTGARSE